MIDNGSTLRGNPRIGLVYKNLDRMDFEKRLAIEADSNRFLQHWNVVKKSELLRIICPICQRSYSWRKKWKDVWLKVRYCSERCRRSSKIK
jgi:hypothetical protein